MIERCYCCSVTTALDDPGPYCEECQILVDFAVNAVSKARHLGVPKYGASSWKEISTDEHLDHVKDHLMYLEYDKLGIQTTNEDHLAHAICRLVMAKANENTSSS